MENKEGKAIDRKQRNVTSAKHSASRIRRATVSCATPPRSKEIFDFQDVFHSSSDSSKNSSDQEDNQPSMTKDIMQDKRTASQPISIPRVKVSNQEAMRDDYRSFHHSPSGSSVGDVYNSPKLPRPSDDFNHVMVKLQHRNDVKRIQSCDDVTIHDSDGNSKICPFPLSASLPPEAMIPRIKGRRSVHFDETTITTTADLGESASRFRQLFRKKRGLTTPHCYRFGESKTITVQHEEAEDDNVPSPQLDRKDKNKSIFDVCNYSSYGRYT